MDSNYIFTYIIGYRHSTERLQNLRRVLSWINGFAGVEVILVEQDTHSKISHLNLRAKHIFTKSDLPYNRSWAFNVGLKYSTTDTIVFGDSDIIIEPNQFIDGLRALQTYEMVSPYSSVIDLTIQETNSNLEQIVNINRPGRGENDNQKINFCGGVLMIRKQTIYKMGCWNEQFWSWGSEDNYLTLCMEKLEIPHYEVQGRCYHLYHDRSNLVDQISYQRNLNLLSQFSKMSKEQLLKYIQISLTKVGMKNLLS